MASDSEAERICVLGGGFGGLYTALRLQNMPWSGRKPIVTLVDKRDKFTFLPLLYEFAGEMTCVEFTFRQNWPPHGGLKESNLDTIKGSFAPLVGHY